MLLAREEFKYALLQTVNRASSKREIQVRALTNRKPGPRFLEKQLKQKPINSIMLKASVVPTLKQKRMPVLVIEWNVG